MSHTRECVRCGEGTETCIIGNFYTCSLCDAETIDEPVVESRPTSYNVPFGVDIPNYLPCPRRWFKAEGL